MARTKKDMSQIVADWLSEIEEAKKREKDFRKGGDRIIEIYSGNRCDEIPFNILYSNTEILFPALFSQVPRPVVEQKHKNPEDILGNAAANASQRLLEYLIDTNIEGYETYRDGVSSAVLDALLPGRGNTAVKYDAEDDGSKELICVDSKKWNRVYYGYATKWSEVPWMAYEFYFDEDEAYRLFGAKGRKLAFSEGEEPEEEEISSNEEKHQGFRKTALVYQIWDKSDKKIKYIAPSYADGYLLQDDDPLELSGFFNCPKPLQFVTIPGSLIPQSLYKLYENQAKELNRLTRRLNRIIEAIKFRGVYDGSFGDELENIMDEDDNGLVPTDKGASLVEGGFDKAIWVMPIEKLVGVASSLYQAREQCKNVIYEITGISDVIRGSSKASETLGAQKIKEGWGTMRLKRLQAMVQEYARDLLRLMLDLAIKKLSVESWQSMTGLNYPRMEQKQQAQQLLQAIQMQVQQLQAQGQQPPQQLQQQAQQAQMVLQQPSWEEIMEVLGDDYQRTYRIDIETNSTLDVEATEDKKLISEFMNAMAQLMNGVAPMVKEGILPFNAMKSMLLEISQRFRFGRTVEDEIKQMQAPKGPQIPPEIQKQIEEGKKQVQEAQKQIQQKQQELQKKEQELQRSEQQISVNKQKAESDFEKGARDISKKLDEDMRAFEEMKKDFEFEKKLFQKEIEYLKKLDSMERKYENDKMKTEISQLIDSKLDEKDEENEEQEQE